jgi:hypothetical protein
MGSPQRIGPTRIVLFVFPPCGVRKAMKGKIVSSVWMSSLLALSAGCPVGNIPPGDAGSPGPDAAGTADAGNVQDAGSTADSGAPDAGPVVSLSLALHREDGGSPSAILAWVNATAGGIGIDGLSVEVTAGPATLPATSQGGGAYLARIVPPFTSGELPVSAQLAGQDAGPSMTALVLPTVADGWDQPISLGGLVNTPGTEDSSTISPDGQWLIVGTYMVVDGLCCAFGCGYMPSDSRNPYCQDVTGPYDAPARPNMPGADRILSPHRILSIAPNFCLVGADGGDLAFPLPDGGEVEPALPPVAAYGFHRQPDGTFAEPFLLFVDDDGFTASPFCFSFVNAPSNGAADIVVAYKRIDDLAAPWQPAYAQLQLGGTNQLGGYACVNGKIQFTPGPVYPLPVSPATQQAGNTSVGAGYLWSDDETKTPAVTIVSQGLSDGGLTPWQALPLPSPGDDRRQPVFFGDRIFYYRTGAIASASWTGLDPTAPSSFGTPVTELAGDAIPVTGILGFTAGRVVAVGQPTFATLADGSLEMYFVYYQRTATGFDGQIGRVPHR